jgi:hypothetical protein
MCTEDVEHCRFPVADAVPRQGHECREDRPKFDKVARFLNERLDDVQVIKVGHEAEKKVIVIGRT